MLAQLISHQHVPSLIIEETSAVADTERQKFLDRIAGFAVSTTPPPLPPPPLCSSTAQSVTLHRSPPPSLTSWRPYPSQWPALKYRTTTTPTARPPYALPYAFYVMSTSTCAHRLHPKYTQQIICRRQTTSSSVAPASSRCPPPPPTTHPPPLPLTLIQDNILRLPSRAGLIVPTFFKIPDPTYSPPSVLNAHPGLLPDCRGSASPAWSVFHDIRVGSTVRRTLRVLIKCNTLHHVHVCEPGIDTGPIIRSCLGHARHARTAC
jgi:hypothetical protein